MSHPSRHHHYRHHPMEPVTIRNGGAKPCRLGHPSPSSRSWPKKRRKSGTIHQVYIEPHPIDRDPCRDPFWFDTLDFVRSPRTGRSAAATRRSAAAVLLAPAASRPPEGTGALRPPGRQSPPAALALRRSRSSPGGSSTHRAHLLGRERLGHQRVPATGQPHPDGRGSA